MLPRALLAPFAPDYTGCPHMRAVDRDAERATASDY